MGLVQQETAGGQQQDFLFDGRPVPRRGKSVKHDPPAFEQVQAVAPEHAERGMMTFRRLEIGTGNVQLRGLGVVEESAGPELQRDRVRRRRQVRQGIGLVDGKHFRFAIGDVNKPPTRDLCKVQLRVAVPAQDDRTRQLCPDERFLVEIAKVGKRHILEVLPRADRQRIAGLQCIHARLDGQKGRGSTRAVMGVVPLLVDEVLRALASARSPQLAPIFPVSGNGNREGRHARLCHLPLNLPPDVGEALVPVTLRPWCARGGFLCLGGQHRSREQATGQAEGHEARTDWMHRRTSARGCWKRVHSKHPLKLRAEAVQRDNAQVCVWQDAIVNRWRLPAGSALAAQRDSILRCSLGPLWQVSASQAVSTGREQLTNTRPVIALNPPG